MRATDPVVLRLGLTGGIGSGKSTVAQLFQRRGAKVIDADAISRACTQAGGLAMTAIRERFGAAFVADDGGLNRPLMRDHVFTHPAARQELEAIIHPLVADEVQRQSCASDAPCLVFDIPLLVESSHWRHRVDRIIVVDCDTETQVRRVAERNGWDRPTIEAILRTQSPRKRRITAADMVLFNDGNEIEPLARMVDELARGFGL